MSWHEEDPSKFEHGPHDWEDIEEDWRGCVTCGRKETWISLWALAKVRYHTAMGQREFDEAAAIALGVKSGFYGDE